MMNYTRILVALSLTDGRDAAFERGLALARRSGAELYLLHAVPNKRPFSYRAAERLERATALRERARSAGVIAETYEQHGDPATIIVLHADARHADLIVMGAERRRTGFARLFRRSVAEQVLRRTSRPTLIVGSDDTDAPGFEHALVALDLAPGSASLLDPLARPSAGDDAKLTVLHAVTGLEPASAVHHRARWIVPEYRRHLLDDARRELAHAVPWHRPADRAVHLRVVAGPAAETIAAQAADVDADLIVMGRSRRRPGATAARVLRQTDRALLMVPSMRAA